MDNFLTIAQDIIDSNAGDSTRDIFKTAVQVYEDEYGNITDAEADKFYSAFQLQLSFLSHMEKAGFYEFPTKETA